MNIIDNYVIEETLDYDGDGPGNSTGICSSFNFGNGWGNGDSYGSQLTGDGNGDFTNNGVGICNSSTGSGYDHPVDDSKRPFANDDIEEWIIWDVIISMFDE